MVRWWTQPRYQSRYNNCLLRGEQKATRNVWAAHIVLNSERNHLSNCCCYCGWCSCIDGCLIFTCTLSRHAEHRGSGLGSCDIAHAARQETQLGLGLGHARFHIFHLPTHNQVPYSNWVWIDSQSKPEHERFAQNWPRFTQKYCVWFQL